ncbi:MAG: hypothetical protein Q9184_005963 [Pyrenodesmia sp. 2 TL-2023]
MPRLAHRLRALLRGELIHDILTDPPAPTQPIALTISSPHSRSPSPPDPSLHPRSPSPHPNSHLYLPPHRKPVAHRPPYDPNFLHEASQPLLHFPTPSTPSISSPPSTPSETHPRTTGLITPHAVFQNLLHSQQPITEGEWIAMGKARERERQRSSSSSMRPSSASSTIRGNGFLERCRERHRRRHAPSTTTTTISSSSTTICQESIPDSASETKTACCCTRSSMRDLLANSTSSDSTTNSSTEVIADPDEREDDADAWPNGEGMMAFCGEPLTQGGGACWNGMCVVGTPSVSG